jgi:hypothetical protein
MGMSKSLIHDFRNKISQNYILYQLILFFFISWNAFSALQDHWNDIFNQGWENVFIYIGSLLTGLLIGAIVKLIPIQKDTDRFIQFIIGIGTLMTCILLNFTILVYNLENEMFMVNLLIFFMAYTNYSVDFQLIIQSRAISSQDPTKKSTLLANYGHWLAQLVGVSSIFALAFVIFPVNAQLISMLSILIMAICLLLSFFSFKLFNKSEDPDTNRMKSSTWSNWMIFSICNMFRYILLIAFYAVFVALLISDKTSVIIGFLLNIEDHGILTSSLISWLVIIGAICGLSSMFSLFYICEKRKIKKSMAIIMGIALEVVFALLFTLNILSSTNLEIILVKAILIIALFVGMHQILYISIGRKLIQLRY